MWGHFDCVLILNCFERSRKHSEMKTKLIIQELMSPELSIWVGLCVDNMHTEIGNLKMVDFRMFIIRKRDTSDKQFCSEEY